MPVEVKQHKKRKNKRSKKVSQGSVLDEDQLAEKALEEVMTIMDSLCPEIQENVEAKETEECGEPEITNKSFLEYMDELCSDEDFVENVDSFLNIDFLDSFEHEGRQTLNTENLEVLSPKSTQVTMETKASDLRSESGSLSPMKRKRQRCVASEERLNEPSMDEVGTEDDAFRSSPMKRHKVEKKREAKVTKKRDKVERCGCTGR
ncbi:NUT family member 1-like isoform X3 [Acanthochromis polyacanthus]|uniref:NUT family member 1-like isoform X2 n=1 Tax=Acanthochromis polyacanthus TaxID=80966 RepID=UPI0022344B3C|nr:NUT family member 1-like isoform X2 [Acanthochromis polyacanthus]XP_051800139.1 NUT family member 1-like isoform X3 [Acanthochromis polyacanthus]